MLLNTFKRGRAVVPETLPRILRLILFFLLIFLFVLSLLIFNASPFYATAIKFKGIALYARIFFLVTSYYLLKYLLLKMAASLFEIKKIIAAHLSIMAISNFVYVMAILPILLFYQFLPKAAHQNLIYLMIFLWVLNAIYKYLRSGAYVSSNFRFPKTFGIFSKRTLARGGYIISIKPMAKGILVVPD